MNDCATCVHWERWEDIRRYDYLVPRDEAWGTCARIGHGHEAGARERAEEMGEEYTPGSPRAYTRDASDYASHLNTRADFGCVEHQERPADG